MDEGTKATLTQVQSHLAAAGSLLAGLTGPHGDRGTGPLAVVLKLVEGAQAALKKLLAGA